MVLSCDGVQVGDASISSIVVYPGKLLPRVDVYVAYDERVSIRDSIKRVSDKLQILASDEVWGTIRDKHNLLRSLSGWEDMLDGWLAESGVQIHDTTD